MKGKEKVGTSGEKSMEQFAQTTGGARKPVLTIKNHPEFKI